MRASHGHLARLHGRVCGAGIVLPIAVVPPAALGSLGRAGPAFHAEAARSAGQCLVPLADIFNHKAAVVEVGAGFSVAELDDASDDDTGGSAGGEAGDKSDAESHSDAEASGGEPVTAASDAADAAPPRARRPRDDAAASRGAAAEAAEGSATAADEDVGGDGGDSSAAKKPRVGCYKPEDAQVRPRAAQASTAAGEGEPEAGTAAGEGEPDTGAGGKEGALNGEGEMDAAEKQGSKPGDKTDADDAEATEQLRKERLTQLEALLGINLGLEIAIIDAEVVDGVEDEDGEDDEDDEVEDEEGEDGEDEDGVEKEDQQEKRDKEADVVVREEGPEEGARRGVFSTMATNLFRHRHSIDV